MRAEKQWLLDEMISLIQESKSLVVTRYKQIAPNDSWSLRENLAKNNSVFEVVKNRIFLKALRESGIEVKDNKLEGHIGVLFTKEDSVGPTKAVFDYSKAHGDTLEIVFGHVDGQYCSAEDVKSLSKLPSKDEMRAQLLSTFEAPMSQTLAVCESFLTSIMYCLENKSQTEEKKV